MSAIKEAAAVAGLYEADYYAWTQDQAKTVVGKPLTKETAA